MNNGRTLLPTFLQRWASCVHRLVDGRVNLFLVSEKEWTNDARVDSDGTIPRDRQHAVYQKHALQEHALYEYTAHCN